MTLDLAIHIGEALGYEVETATYRERLATVRTQLHAKYFDASLNSYATGDQVRTAAALFAGLVPDNLQQTVLNYLEKDLTGEHPYFDVGSFGRYPYFHTLFAHLQFQEIIAGILSKTTYPGYGYFLSKGETAWPEAWEINDLDKHRTHIHTSYTGISSWFIKKLAGIEPTIENPGYRTVSIRPNVIQKLTYAKAGLESPYGLIESGWRKENGKVIYDISIPVGSKAQIYFPAKLSEIRENGQPLTQAAGIKIIEENDDGILIQAESGKYRFKKQ
jgi:alpha-L-rhamnosidase